MLLPGGLADFIENCMMIFNKYKFYIHTHTHFQLLVLYIDKWVFVSIKGYYKGVHTKIIGNNRGENNSTAYHEH